ncbi:hypothetical protein ACFOTA_10025 [Chitinophaga sp. GCM10012297]|uniref:Collagen-like protein n=1 Tax=Chitinophaga chungangae TaxID=2821488 RepID=A0ABS3YCY1_9BACT|nr:hypothetical protein [Chitinophaga chungangae]MBO9152542.1 hypothetical protein [Chitinophaga chungangae]
MQHFMLRLLAAAIMLTAASCSKEGPKGDKGDPGPQGQQGPQGTPGGNGSANAWSYIYSNQTMSGVSHREIDPFTGNFIFTSSRNLTPDRYAAIAPNGLVLVYIRKAGAANDWKLSQLPQLRSEQDGNQSYLLFDARTAPDRVQIVGILDTPVDDRTWLMNDVFDVKIILVEPLSTANYRTTYQLPADIRDVAAVEKYLNIRY